MNRPLAAAALALLVAGSLAACPKDDAAGADTAAASGTVSIATQAKGVARPPT